MLRSRKLFAYPFLVVFFSLLLSCATIPYGLHAQTSGIGTNPGSPGIGTNPGSPGIGTNPGCGSSGGTTGLFNPLNSCDIQTLLGKVLDAAIQIGAVFVTLMLVYCGFLFVAAQGNDEKIRDARSALMWTVIGALVLLGAKVIQSVIVSTVGTL